MPKVKLVTKSKAGKPYSCDKCRKAIEPGQQYYSWSFRFGGTQRQHQDCGVPRASQLTQSKMSGVYSAIETAEDGLAGASSTEDFTSLLSDCASEVDSVKEEYQDALDNMPESLQSSSVGEEIQEKIEALETFSDELSNTDFEEREGGETKEDWLEKLRTEAEQVLSELNI